MGDNPAHRADDGGGEEAVPENIPNDGDTNEVTVHEAHARLSALKII
jgi:hypothetical protein